MKTFFALLILGMIVIHPVLSQENFYNFTITTAFSPGQTPTQAGLLINREDPINEFIFNLKEIEKSYVFGFRKNFRFSYPFYGTLGLEYTKVDQHYSMEFTQDMPERNTSYLIHTTNHFLRLPVGVGVKFNNLDVTSGLMVQYDIKSGIHEEWPMSIELVKPQLEMGWYTGIGFSFNRTRIGVEYHSSLKRYGHNMIYQQESMELMSLPGNVRVSIGYSF